MTHTNLPYDHGSIETKIWQWSVELQKVRSECRDLIETSYREKLLQKDNEFRGLLDGICMKLAETLRRLLKDVWDFEDSKQSGDTPAQDCGRSNEEFFLWPGYLRYASRRPGRVDVVMHSNAGTSLGVPAHILLNTLTAKKSGVGFAEDGTPYFSFPLSIWMDFIYGREIEGLVISGFTDWFILNEKFFFEKNSDAFLISAFEIGVSSPDDRRADMDPSIFSIRVEKSLKPDEVFKQIVEPLNDPGLLKCQGVGDKRVLFPAIVHSNRREMSESDADAPAGGASKLTVREVANKVFAVLLHSIFFTPPVGPKGGEPTVKGEWKEYTDNIKEYSHQLLAAGHPMVAELLTKGIEVLRCWSEAAPLRSFRFYYVFPMSRSIMVEGAHPIERDLGTINLYTNKPIPSYCLHLIKPWIQSVYEQVRLVETAIDAEKGGERLQKSIFAHQTATEISKVSLLLDQINKARASSGPEIVSILETRLHFLLWHLDIITQNIWAEAPIKPEEQIWESEPPAIWAKNKEPRQIMEFVLDQAKTRAFSRMKQVSVSKGEPEGEFTFKELAVQGARDLFNGVYYLFPELNRPKLKEDLYYKDFIDSLKFDALENPPEWLMGQGTLLCIYHIAWQAIHQAFRAWFFDKLRETVGRHNVAARGLAAGFKWSKILGTFESYRGEEGEQLKSYLNLADNSPAVKGGYLWTELNYSKARNGGYVRFINSAVGTGAARDPTDKIFYGMLYTALNRGSVRTFKIEGPRRSGNRNWWVTELCVK
jgi:hypothetical protein